MRVKRIFLVAMSVLAAACFLVLLSVIVLQTGPARRYVLGKATGILRNRGIGFHATSLRYNLFALTAELSGVVIRSSGSGNLPPVVSVEKISVHARWPPLLRGVIFIDRAVVERPVIRVVIGKQGHNNIPQLQTSGAGGIGAHVVVANLTVRDGSFTWSDQPRGVELKVPHWRARIGLGPAGGGTDLSFATQGASEVHVAGRLIPIKSVLFDGRLSESALAVKRLQLRSRSTNLSVTGSVKPLANARLDLSLDAQMDAASWARSLGLRQPMKGQVEARLRIEGPWAQTRVEGPIGSSNLSVG